MAKLVFLRFSLCVSPAAFQCDSLRIRFAHIFFGRILCVYIRHKTYFIRSVVVSLIRVVAAITFVLFQLNSAIKV